MRAVEQSIDPETKLRGVDPTAEFLQGVEQGLRDPNYLHILRDEARSMSIIKSQITQAADRPFLNLRPRRREREERAALEAEQYAARQVELRQIQPRTADNRTVNLTDLKTGDRINPQHGQPFDGAGSAPRYLCDCYWVQVNGWQRN